MEANAYQVGGTHYKDLSIEPWDVIDSWSFEQQIGFYRGNALKYLMRMGAKDAPIQEARKSQHYIQKLVELLEVYVNDHRSEEESDCPEGAGC